MQYTVVQNQSSNPSITLPPPHCLEVSQVCQCVIIKLNVCIENYKILNYKNYKSIKHFFIVPTHALHYTLKY